VCGVTRIGVGDGKNAKERIGDAIRNAAMRFGVALDLWAKENLVEFAQHAATAARQEDSGTNPPVEGVAGESGHSPATTTRATKPVQAAIRGAQSVAQKAQAETGELMSANTRGRLFALFGEHGITDRDEQIRGIVHIVGRPIESRAEITEQEAQVVIGVLASRPRPNQQEQP
jgi:hypothetical protein